MTKEQITNIFDKLRFLKNKCDSVDKALENFIRKVSDDQCDAYIGWNAVQGFIDALEVTNNPLYEDLQWYIYELPMFSEEEKTEGIEFKINGKRYIVYNELDFLEYLIDVYAE